MHSVTLSRPEIHLMGIKMRTSNAAEFYPETAKIGACLENYFANAVFDTIPNRKNPGVTFCAYTDYESDEHGEYTYFVGEEVTTPQATPGLDILTIPAQTYVKFTTPMGMLPNIVIDAWQQIWQMTADDFSAPRAYIADFEVYDERAVDPDNSELDIYLGIQSSNS